MPNRSIRVAAVKDVREGAALCVKADEKALALFLVNGAWRAIDNACPHAGGPLCEGEVADGVVTCPWHGSQFTIETGAIVHGPAKTGVKSYPVEVRGDDVYVTLGETTGDPKPTPAKFQFQPAFDAEHPFANQAFVEELVQALKFPFKLYGILPFIVISQSPDEIDAHLGEIHATEVDLQTLSGIMKTMNDKWKTSITYCLFLSTQFPGVFLLNIRGPNAPMSIENTITF